MEYAHIGKRLTAAGSRGKAYLSLLFTRGEWIHRKVESIEFLPDGSTNNSISYDFSATRTLSDFSTSSKTGIPLALLRKHTLLNLNVKDSAGRSLSVWDTESTGNLGVEVLQSAIGGYIGRLLEIDETEAVRRVVFSRNFQNIDAELRFLENLLTSVSPRNETIVNILLALVIDFAENYIFVVDIPNEHLGGRQIVKISYDQALRGKVTLESIWYSRLVFRILRRGLMQPSKSSHLEVYAPEGVQILSLTHSILNASTGEWKSNKSSESTGHIAHIQINESQFSEVQLFDLRMNPAGGGLIFQTFIGVTIGYMYLIFLNLDIKNIFSLTEKASEAGPLATISLALPAFLLTQISRSREHSNVQLILRKPRLIASISSGLLFLSASSLVLGLSNIFFLRISEGLLLVQVVVWILAWLHVVDSMKWFKGSRI